MARFEALFKQLMEAGPSVPSAPAVNPGAGESPATGAASPAASPASAPGSETSPETAPAPEENAPEEEKDKGPEISKETEVLLKMVVKALAAGQNKAVEAFVGKYGKWAEGTDTKAQPGAIYNEFVNMMTNPNPDIPVVQSHSPGATASTPSA